MVVALGNGRFAPREVVLGPGANGFVQVLEGLTDGDEIVTSAQFLIDSESNLREAIKNDWRQSARVEVGRDEGGIRNSEFGFRNFGFAIATVRRVFVMTQEKSLRLRAFASLRSKRGGRNSEDRFSLSPLLRW